MNVTYPLFETFSLIDHDGMQQLKSSLGVFVPPRISVARRDYFPIGRWRAPMSGDSSNRSDR